MIYLTEEGEPITGDSPSELIESLRTGSKFAFEQTTDEFMLGFAERWKHYSGEDIRIDTHANFIEDLIAQGFLSKVE